MMMRFDLSLAREEWGEDLKIASLADIQKSDDTLRILHDGTHGVLVNPEIRQRDQVPTPGLGEEKVVQADLSQRLILHHLPNVQ